MIEITSKGSVYLDRSLKNTDSIVTWKSSYDGQTHYEILYKMKTSDTWSTSGKIESKDTSYDLFNLYEFINLDFTEIQYKVRVYFVTLNDIGELKGTEDSNIYSVVFKSCSDNGLIVYNDQFIHMPLLSENDDSNIQSLLVKVNGKLRRSPLVDSDSPIVSNTTVKIDNSLRRLAMIDKANFIDTPISEDDTFSELSQQKSYNYTYSAEDSYSYQESYVNNYTVYLYSSYYYNGLRVGYDYSPKYGYCDDIQYYYYYASYQSGQETFPVYAPGSPTTQYGSRPLYSFANMRGSNAIIESSYLVGGYYTYGYGGGGGNYYGGAAYRYSFATYVNSYYYYYVATYYWPQKSYLDSYYKYQFDYYYKESGSYRYDYSRSDRVYKYLYNYYYYNSDTTGYYYYLYKAK